MRKSLSLALLPLAAFAGQAQAKPATPMLDCAMRDAPFSVDGPFVDLMLNDKAVAAFDAYLPGVRAALPPLMTGTKAPTFGSIVTARALAGFSGKPMDLAPLDTALKAIPVTDADRVARCERYDDERPSFKPAKGKVRVLLFEKMTGFRDTPSVLAANALFRDLAKRNGWALEVTDKGGAMHPSVLKQFDAVIWNNVSGDVLTLTQRKAFRSFVEGGGGFVGIHGSAGDPVYFWDWYPDTLIGARFIGHPMNPQFQDAKIVIESHPAGLGKGLAPGWTMNDEWYSFAKSARLNGARVVATLDEKSYTPGESRFGTTPLAMGDDHPIAWTRCVGKGRAFYSAIGHRPETYDDAKHQALLTDAVQWAAQGRKGGCVK
jgi:type 1 glutamine amidotransferase